MQWCDNEQNDFPDIEFSLDGGILYHRRPGGVRHPAGLGSVTTQYPEDRPYDVYLYGAPEAEPVEDDDADGSPDGEAAGRD